MVNLDRMNDNSAVLELNITMPEEALTNNAEPEDKAKASNHASEKSNKGKSQKNKAKHQKETEEA